MPLLYPTLIDADTPDCSHQIHVWFQGQFLAVLDPIGAPWLPDGPPDQQNCSYASPRMCRDLFHPYSTVFHQIGATRPTYGQKRTFFASLDPLCTLWCPWMAPYDPQNCCEAPPQLFPDLFHPYSKLFHQIVATRPAYGPKRSFLALLCNLLGALWRPWMAHPDQRNCSDASPRLWPNLFHTFPTFACKGNPYQKGNRKKVDYHEEEKTSKIYPLCLGVW